MELLFISSHLHASMLRFSKTLTSPPAFFRRAALQSPDVDGHQMQWIRGIRVKVLNGNLEQALAFFERKMKSSGMERLIKRQTQYHIKNSEKRVLARKNLELRIRSEDLSRKLRDILIKKIRGL